MISVIIPSYNSEKTIARCISSLKNQDFDEEFEIILVDSSEDTTALIVKEKFPEIRFIHLPQKTDPGTARNIGLRQSNGDLIAFIDSDCYADKDWLSQIRISHQSDFDCVGGVIFNANDRSDSVGWAGYIAEFRDFLPSNSKQRVSHIPTCNISYKKKVFEQFGEFDGSYYPQEDLVFNYKINLGGVQILLNPEIKIHHLHRSVLSDFFKHQFRIGNITARVLKTHQLEGSYIVQHKILAFFLLPLLPAVKFSKTLFQFLKHQPQTIAKQPLAFLVFAVGLLFWIFGFSKGVYFEHPTQPVRP